MDLLDCLSVQFTWHSSIPWVIPTTPNKEHVGEDRCTLLMGRTVHIWYCYAELYGTFIHEFLDNGYILEPDLRGLDHVN